MYSTKDPNVWFLMIRQKSIWKYAKKQEDYKNRGRTWICTWKNIDKKIKIGTILKASYRQKIKWNAQCNTATIRRNNSKLNPQDFMISIINSILQKENISCKFNEATIKSTE